MPRANSPPHSAWWKPPTCWPSSPLPCNSATCRHSPKSASRRTPPSSFRCPLRSCPCSTNSLAAFIFQITRRSVDEHHFRDRRPRRTHGTTGLGSHSEHRHLVGHLFRTRGRLRRILRLRLLNGQTHF